MLHAGEGNAILGPLMGRHSLLLTDEGVHLRARKLLMPAFNGAACVAIALWWTRSPRRRSTAGATGR
ncbi:MAG: hypothetical protein WKF83_15475 [Nocardioidaceae bacterium]